eukprot:2540004-Prymnesium_polylepis.1
MRVSRDGGRVITPARLETHRGRLKMWVSSCDALGCLEMGGPISCVMTHEHAEQLCKKGARAARPPGPTQRPGQRGLSPMRTLPLASLPSHLHKDSSAPAGRRRRTRGTEKSAPHPP